MSTLTITKGTPNDVVVSVNETDVSVTQGNNIVVEVTPTPVTTLNIDKGIIGPQGPQGQAGEGVASGGTTGQVLYKASNADYDTDWETLGTMAMQNSNSVAITGGTATGFTNLESDYLQLDTAQATAIALGKLRWNQATATASFGIVDGTDEVNIGEQMFAYVTNAESVAITRGQAVYLYQATGNRASVKLAYNTGDATSAKTLGLVAQDSIGANQTGFVITQGQLSKMDLGAFSEGATLYLGATAGTLTATKPKAPNHLVYMGVVERANAGNGQMYVKPQNGYELDEIHDVQINSPANGQTIIYDASTSLWKNANITAGTGVTITNGPSSITISAPDNGTVTSVSGTGTVSGISLSGTVTSSGSLTLGGALDLSSPPAIGATTPNTGKFTTLQSTGNTFLNTSSGTTAIADTSSIGQFGVKLGTGFGGGSAWDSRVALFGNVNTATGAGSGALGFSFDTSLGASFMAIAPAVAWYNMRYMGNTHQFFGFGAEQLRITPINSAVNFHNFSGSTTTKALTYYATGTDTNISMAFQPKGTGAIDLAAGSSGVNISNGGTVTAITRTGSGSGYTTSPTIAISAPTTAGGVQATASAYLSLQIDPTITSGGTGYTVGDVLTLVGGTFTGGNAATLTVTTVAAGVVTGFTRSNFGNLYTAVPSNPISVTGGTGTGATFNATNCWGIQSTYTITNAGSGYIEQPTVSFSGGGGSGASAYATVGGDTTVKALGQVLNLATDNGTNFRVSTSGQLATYYWQALGHSSVAILRSSGSTQAGQIHTAGTGSLQLGTNGGIVQLNVSNTSSSVNYLQATGSATGTAVQLSAQGSDTNISVAVQPKGTGSLQAQKTDSTAVGGNARGANATDWQTSRAVATQVASGQYAVVGGGVQNIASAFTTTVAGGFNNNASGYSATITGGTLNVGSGAHSAIAGGYQNTSGQFFSFVGGGYGNNASGYYNVIGGGQSNSGTAVGQVTTQTATTNSTTTVTLDASNASIKVGQVVTGTNISTNTYVTAISSTTLTISQVASGSGATNLFFWTPHGVVVGGGNNQATGAYSFIGGGGDAGTASNRNTASGDWSFVGGGRKNVASGAGSIIVGGGSEGTNTFGNTASGQISAIVGGWNHTASGYGSFIGGGSTHTANATFSTVVGGALGTVRGISGNIVFPACNIPIAGTAGTSQSSVLILGRQTTDATPTALTSDTNAAGTTNQIILPNNSAYFVRGTIIAGVTGGGNTSAWDFKGAIKRGANAASTALVSAITANMVAQDAGASTWAVAITADTTNGGLKVTVTGQAATTIRWVCEIETTEMTY